MEQLSRTCAACGKERKKKGLIVYTADTLTPYCQNPYVCNSKHPNSPENLMARQSMAELISYEEAAERMENMLKEKYADKGVYNKVSKILDTPSTVRISEPDMAEFLVSIMIQYNLDSKSDAIRFCIQEAMTNHKEFDMKTYQLEKSAERKEVMKEALKQLEESKEESLASVKEEAVKEIEEHEKAEQIKQAKEEKEKEETLKKTEELANDLDELIF